MRPLCPNDDKEEDLSSILGQPPPDLEPLEVRSQPSQQGGIDIITRDRERPFFVPILISLAAITLTLIARGWGRKILAHP